MISRKSKIPSFRGVLNLLPPEQIILLCNSSQVNLKTYELLNSICIETTINESANIKRYGAPGWKNYEKIGNGETECKQTAGVFNDEK